MQNNPIYIIGDIHGMYEPLCDLMDKIKEHRIAHSVEDPEICFVGDYVDRGPKSKDVLQYVKTLTESYGGSEYKRITALMGNHEDMMYRALRGSSWYKSIWLSNGGAECMESFGYNNDARALVGDEMIDWVANLPRYYVLNNVAIAHAGIDYEDLLVSEHTEENLLWSRVLRMHPHEIYKYTVHGHTPMNSALVDENVAYIDTGAVFGGSLTCLYIPDTVNPNYKEMEILDVRVT